MSSLLTDTFQLLNQHINQWAVNAESSAGKSVLDSIFTILAKCARVHTCLLLAVL